MEVSTHSEISEPDQGFLQIRSEIDQKRETKEVLDEFLRDIKNELSAAFRNLKKFSENAENFKNENDLKVSQEAYDRISGQLINFKIKLDEKYEENKDSFNIFKFDNVGCDFLLAELYLYFIKNVDASAASEVNSTLLLPYQSISLKWTTPDNYLIAVCKLTCELNHYCLTLALLQNKKAYDRILTIYKFVSQIYENLMNMKIARNCPLRRSYDAVKWQKREIQKICYDLMLVEESVGLEENA